MKYELAKQLYKKGSPFTSSIPVTEANMKYIDFPTLSELIEACGDDFFQLTKGSNQWYAENDDGEGNIPIQSGSTPEEAVVKLWLELNK